MQTFTKNRKYDRIGMDTKRVPDMIEMPSRLTYHNVMYWEPESRKLLELKREGSTQAATLLTKAKKFLEYKCIKKVGEHKYQCMPLKGYNSTTYNISNQFGWDCDCQGFHNNKICSHILAVKMNIFMEEINNDWSR